MVSSVSRRIHAGTCLLASDAVATPTVQLAEIRATRYEAYFNAILDEEEELRRLHAPLDQVLDEAGGSTAKLRFVVRRRIDTRAWAQQGEELLDLRTAGPFHGVGEMARIAKEQLEDAWGDLQPRARRTRRPAAVAWNARHSAAGSRRRCACWAHGERERPSG
jgi:hypothetical protein